MKYFLFGLFLLLQCSMLFSQSSDKITPELRVQMEGAEKSKINVICLLDDKADVFAMHQSFRDRKLDQKNRIQELVAALQKVADRSQPELIEWLERKQGFAAKDIKRHFIINAISIAATADEIEAIATHKSVGQLSWNAPILALDDACGVPTMAPPGPNDSENSLGYINATAMWELGYTGHGTIAFNIDTGTDSFHPAYINRWMGSYSSFESAWLDTQAPTTSIFPNHCENDHGTHTLGTMLGLDRMTKDTIGVAFNARWMASDAICDGLTGNNITSLELALNPDGDLNTIDDVPTVINNSWRDPNVSSSECSSMYVDLFEVLEAAGIAVIFACGNNGSAGASSITAPSNINSSLVNSFVVGNINTSGGTFPIAGSSSQGPSTCGGTGSLLIKPEVSAPGSNIRSCTSDRSYGVFSGTSMASPHVAGAICLLKEAFPDALSEDLKYALYNTAVDLGVPGEDNAFGMGIIDVFAAYNYLIEQDFVPSTPDSDLDIIGADSDLATGYCQGNLNMLFYVMNGGDTEITSFEYTIDLYNNSGTLVSSNEGSWNGNVAANEIATVNANLDEVPGGNYFVNFMASAPNGMEDPRPTNNAVAKLISVNATPAVDYNINSEIVETFCEGSQVLLTGSLNLTSDYRMSWYADPAGNQLLGQGNEWLSPVISENTEVYVQAESITEVGPEIPNQGEYTNDNALKINVLAQGMKLESVMIEADAPGAAVIALVRNNDEVIKVKNAILTSAGKHKVEVDFDLETGTQKLRILGGKKLLEKTSDVSFPYLTTSDVLITGSDNGSNVYPYFFDMVFTKEYNCDPLLIVLEPGATSGFESSITASSEDVEINEPIDFSSSNTDISAVSWLFGDGNVSAELSPTHQYEEAGTYLVSMVVVGPDGCSKSYQKEIVVNLTSSTSNLLPDHTITLYPNPGKSWFELSVEEMAGKKGSIELFDISGRSILQLANDEQLLGRYSFDLAGKAVGMYFLQVRVEGQGELTKKLILQ